mmetsp:Transcript_5032/g.7723  ORF Transcript_5032/g.7723 Transcript_5032/m.7723 type:complete len:106 (-) Transcript_5032:264-581(-)
MPNVVFTDRENVPDMKPCSCVRCRENCLSSTCLFKDVRNITDQVVREVGQPATSAGETATDEYGLAELGVQELKHQLRERYLSVSGRKAELIERLSAALGCEDDE